MKLEAIIGFALSQKDIEPYRLLNSFTYTIVNLK